MPTRSTAPYTPALVRVVADRLDRASIHDETKPLYPGVDAEVRRMAKANLTAVKSGIAYAIMVGRPAVYVDGEARIAFRIEPYLEPACRRCGLPVAWTAEQADVPPLPCARPVGHDGPCQGYTYQTFVGRNP